MTLSIRRMMSEIVDEDIRAKYGDLVMEVKEFGSNSAMVLTGLFAFVDLWDSFPGSEEQRQEVFMGMLSDMAEQFNHLWDVFTNSYKSLFGEDYKAVCPEHGENCGGDNE
jgi:hypothetical protein